MSCNTRLFSVKKTMAQLTFNREVTIKLDDYFITIGKAQNQISEFGNRFEWADRGLEPKYLSNRTKVKARHSSIRMAEFLKLYHLSENAARSAQVTDNEYVTGIRIKIGAELVSETVRLFYQPIYMTKKATSTANLFKGEIKSGIGEKVMYEYNETTEMFQLVLVKDVESSRAIYHENMCMMGIENDSTYRRPTVSDDWTGDTKSAVFSFQELFKLYELNYQQIDPGFTYNSEVRVFSGAVPKKDPNGAIQTGRFKHTLLFSRLKDGSEAVIDENYPGGPPEEDQLANLGHLCPPATNCDEIEYPTGP